MPWRRNKRHKNHNEQKEVELSESERDRGPSDEICGICMRNHKAEDVVRTPCCRQVYCMTCLKSWVKFAEGTHHNTVSESECLCPTCRSPFQCVIRTFRPRTRTVIGWINPWINELKTGGSACTVWRPLHSGSPAPPAVKLGKTDSYCVTPITTTCCRGTCSVTVALPRHITSYHHSSLILHLSRALRHITTHW